MSDTLGWDVVQSLDTLLAERPEKVGHDFSDAVRRLVAWREHLALRWRNTGATTDREYLERVNAAISVLVGGKFPLGPVPWPHIERVRQDMAARLPTPCVHDALPNTHSLISRPAPADWSSRLYRIRHPMACVREPRRCRPNVPLHQRPHDDQNAVSHAPGPCFAMERCDDGDVGPRQDGGGAGTPRSDDATTIRGRTVN